MIAEQCLDLFALVHSQQAVVDEYASQLLADCLVDEDRGNRRVHPTRQPADYATCPNLFADFRDFCRAKFGHRPVARQPADFMHEVGNQLGTIGRMDDLGVEHRGVIRLRLIDADRKRRIRRGADNFETFGRLRDSVAVAHPHRIASADFPEAIEQRAGFQDFNIGAAKFRRVAALDRTAQLRAQSLLAVTDREDRQAAVEHHLRRAGTAFGHHRCRTARQYDAFGFHSLERFGGGIEWGDLGVHPGLTHPSCDELSHLATKVDDKDGIRRL